MILLRPTVLQNIEAVFFATMLSLISIAFAGGLVLSTVLLAIRLERLTLLSFYWALTRSIMTLIFLVVTTGVINCIYNSFYLKPGAPHTDFFFGEEFNSRRRVSPPAPLSRPSTAAEALPVVPADRPLSPEPDTGASEYEAESESSANEAERDRRIPVAQLVRPRMVAMNVALSVSPQNSQSRQSHRAAGIAT